MLTDLSVSGHVQTISKSETGLAKNVADFNRLVIAVKSFGPEYNPSNRQIRIANLDRLKSQLDNSLNNVQRAYTSYMEASEKQHTSFEKMLTLVAKVTFELKSNGRYTLEKDNAISACEKISELFNRKKTLQINFDTCLQLFRQLSASLSVMPEYSPAEKLLQTDSLIAYANMLKDLNDNVNYALNELNKLRAERDDLLFNDVFGAKQALRDVKDYVKNVFRTDSSEFKVVTAIKI